VRFCAGDFLALDVPLLLAPAAGAERFTGARVVLFAGAVLFFFDPARGAEVLTPLCAAAALLAVAPALEPVS
jgi:hypothetical protein